MDIKDFNEQASWHDTAAREKENQVVVKLKKDDGSFLKSIIIPTLYYPLNGKYEVFTSKNTVPVVDERTLDVFDSVQRKVGFCYTNADNLNRALLKAGIESETYVGWLFTDATEVPIHHCWCVVRNGNEKSVLDLSDDYTVMLSGKNGEQFEGKTLDEKRQLIVDFTKASQKVSNRVRCGIVGTPTPFLYYIGSKCDPGQGRKIYCDLIRTYPNHECERNCVNGMNKTQSMMMENGLM